MVDETETARQLARRIPRYPGRGVEGRRRRQVEPVEEIVKVVVADETKIPSPSTPSSCEGVVVPTPTLPAVANKPLAAVVVANPLISKSPLNCAFPAAVIVAPEPPVL